jgi:hypothetical protein
MGRITALSLVAAASACACACRGGAPNAIARVAGRDQSAAWTAVAVPGGVRGIGFDDVRYVAAIDRVLVPAGHTGALVLLRPTSLEVEQVTGFATQDAFRGGHDVGTTSADGGDGIIVATDRTARMLVLVDPQTKAIVSSAPLRGKPDLVRLVDAPQNPREVWVTEPESERIEVFALSAGPHPGASPSGFIMAPGGPEGLTVDRLRARAYTHLGSTTVAIDLKSRQITARWTTGCASPTGIALDEVGALLFVACSDGQVAVVDLSKDRLVVRLQVSSNVDHLAFSPRTRHLFVPDTKTARLTILAVSREGQLEVLNTMATVAGTECVTTDDREHVYLCDPEHGRILVMTDSNASSTTDR